jgi:hypothetical protein
MCGKALTLVQKAERSKHDALKRARLFVFVTKSPYENVWGSEVMFPRIPNLGNGRILPVIFTSEPFALFKKGPNFPIVNRLKGRKSRSELCGEDTNTFTMPEIANTFLEKPEYSPECDFSILQKQQDSHMRTCYVTNNHRLT